MLQIEIEIKEESLIMRKEEIQRDERLTCGGFRKHSRFCRWAALAKKSRSIALP